VPTLITLLFPSLLTILLLTQLFYVVVIVVYVQFLSLEKSYYPYYSSELTNTAKQLRKGKELGISAFLLITIYGIIILKIGKIALPHLINLGTTADTYIWAIVLLALLNPLLEELFWRLFLLKVPLVPRRPSKSPTKGSISPTSATCSSTSRSSAHSWASGGPSPSCSPSTASGAA
jgi:membrane protease YdiL (CAAX protease family)